VDAWDICAIRMHSVAPNEKMHPDNLPVGKMKEMRSSLRVIMRHHSRRCCCLFILYALLLEYDRT